MEENLKKAKEVLAIQENSVSDEYMCGMFNGMELIIAILEDRTPLYYQKKYVKDSQNL